MNWRRAVMLVLLIGTAACHRKVRSAAPTPIPAIPAAAIPAAPPNLPVPTPAAPPAALIEADSAFDTGDFARAARSYSTYLQSNPRSNGMDRILFNLGIAQTMTAST